MLTVARQRERLPTPNDVERDLRDIRSAIDERKITLGDRVVTIPSLADEYRWAYGASLAPSVKDRTSSGPTIADDGSVPGATAAAAAEKEAMRARVAQAAEKIGKAVSNLRSARDDLDAAMRRLSPPEGYVPAKRFPRTASDADLADAREAQERRRAAGQGFGET